MLNNSASKRIALSGILAVFVLIFLYLSMIVPTNRIFFYCLSSVFISISIIEFGIKAGWLFFFGTSLMVLIFLPDKIKLIPYFIIIGHYGIWKWYLEKRFNIFLEFFIKCLILNIGMLAVYVIYKNLLFTTLDIKIDLRVAWIILQPIFIVYDYVFSIFISFYFKRIKPYIFDN